MQSFIGISLFAQEKNKSDLHTVEDVDWMVYVFPPRPVLFYIYFPAAWTATSLVGWEAFWLYLNFSDRFAARPMMHITATLWIAMTSYTTFAQVCLCVFEK